MKPRVRVLVIDDSAFARKALRTVLSRSPEIEVVGIARDGLEGLEKIAELKPDVVTLDLVMPNLDGLGLLRALPAVDAPRVVVVSISEANSELAISALQLGAVDIVRKPTALATDQLYELDHELVSKVLQAASARRPTSTLLSPVSASAAAIVPRNTRLMVIGASTGGPSAITRLLSALPANFPVPIVVALHIPAGYTDALAIRLNEQSALAVEEAREGAALRPGLAVLAKGGEHVIVRAGSAGLTVHLTRQPFDSLYFPSVDRLFESAVQALGSAVLGIVLTGMGDDGRKGSGAIRQAGGTVLTEAESSCVIYGMPRSVVEAGYSSAAAPLERLPATILAHL
jgi:two-component system, chemotaxis family, protein-glutamate methylesterase/glutaminase